ncbi:MAG TPA: DsbA family protein [Pseudomonadales bacterium]|jgi:2-hydroxychromene-2-carboxylate isomerase|nr:2-hydroxychromene-2-carboxylate isomerase [Gammaproteobacteria bacterium]MDP6027371.1 DsbA family protein [Pseudomonadales bacterium]HJP51592.1 DsbA family protein [Pseudomonadales bacterium]|tara:strand:- start:401 stop:1075 length:675 start_codon:yes stop_codon:yes gene_type:complete
MMKKLEVYIDYKSPYAYIAKDPTYALEKDFGIEIDWYPLTLNIGSYLGTAKTNDTGKVLENNRSPRQWLAVKYAYMDARRYASLRGMTLKGTQKIWDSSIAAIGLLWAKAQNRTILKRYTDVIYERFWRRDLDIEDVAVVSQVLKESGADIKGFDLYLSGEGRRIHDDLQDAILDMGYFGVPTYVIDDEIYFGREHLPRVRWHLAGCEGPMPDIAYDTVLDEAS